MLTQIKMKIMELPETGQFPNLGLICCAILKKHLGLLGADALTQSVGHRAGQGSWCWAHLLGQVFWAPRIMIIYCLQGPAPGTLDTLTTLERDPDTNGLCSSEDHQWLQDGLAVGHLLS